MSTQRKRTLWLFGASTLVALVIVVVAIAISQGSDDSDSGGSSGGNGSGSSSPAALFKGIPQQDARLGDPNAPARLVEFVDLQCPFCAEYSRSVLPQLVRRYVRSGQLQIEMRPLAFLGDESVLAARATASAGTQNRLWQFAETFYANQGQENSGYVTRQFLRKIARESGVSPARVIAAAQSSVTPPLLSSSGKEAERRKISGTPSFLLASKGQPLQPLRVQELSFDQFQGPIEAAIGQ